MYSEYETKFTYAGLMYERYVETKYNRTTHNPIFFIIKVKLIGIFFVYFVDIFYPH